MTYFLFRENKYHDIDDIDRILEVHDRILEGMFMIARTVK